VTHAGNRRYCVALASAAVLLIRGRTSMTVGPFWLAYVFAAVVVGTAGCCAARLVAAWVWRRRIDHAVDALHMVMGLAMAGMFVSSLRVPWTPAWLIVFGAATGWFAGMSMRAVWTRDSPRPGSPVAHAVASASMFYMFLAVPSAQMTGGRGAASMVGGLDAHAMSEHLPLLGLSLGFALLGYVWSAMLRLTGLAGTATGSGLATEARSSGRPDGAVTAGGCGPGFLAPRLAECCDVAMGAVMAVALIALA
jgi:hypothetical protein